MVMCFKTYISNLLSILAETSKRNLNGWLSIDYAEMENAMVYFVHTRPTGLVILSILSFHSKLVR